MLLPKRLCTLGSLSFASLPLLLGTSSWGSELSEHHVSPLYKNESTIKTYGPMTRYASALQKKLINIERDSPKPIFPQNIAYINAAASLTSHHQSHIQKTLASGGTIIIDSTENQNKAIAKKISATLGGIGFDSPIIMIRKNSDGISEYKQLIPHFPEDHEADKTPSHHLDHETLSEETVSMLQDWQKKSSKYRAKERDNHYRPEVSIPVELRYTNFPCMVGDTFHGNGTTGYWYWDDKLIDACNKNASVSLFYTVDLIRSVSSTAGGADDAKYVRITVDPSSNGGAGWHLTDQPDHKHTWFQSWTNRETWFGPVADSYYVTIQSNDPDVHLYNTIPSNHPKESQIMHTIGLQVGVSGGPSLLNPALMGAGAGAGANPVGFSGINMGLSFTYTSERAISYNNHEYELINLSRAGNTDKAAWIWSREFSKYAQHWRTNRTCELWCQDWFYDDVAFSAASYSSFTPGFSATFQVPANKADTSTLEFESAIKAVALGGRVQYAFLFQHYTPWGFKGTKYSFKQNLDINWGATFFNAEIPVSIEAYKENSEHGICLEVIDSKTEAGSKVGIGDCHFNQNQIWGMDSEFRYKSFLAQDHCLTREGHETLTIRPCTHAANQKWEWDNEHLINNLGGAMTIKEGNRVIACPHTQTPTEWRNFIRKPDITGTMTVSALTMTTDEPNAKRPQRAPDYSPEPNSSDTQQENTAYPPSSIVIDDGIEQDSDDDTDYDSVNKPLESTENPEETVWSDKSPLPSHETDQASSAYSALDANAGVPNNTGTESTYTMIIKQTNDDD